MPSSPKLRGRRTHEKRLSTNPIFRVLVVVVVVVLVLMFRGKTRSGSPRGVATQNDASPAYLDMGNQMLQSAENSLADLQESFTQGFAPAPPSTDNSAREKADAEKELDSLLLQIEKRRRDLAHIETDVQAAKLKQSNADEEMKAAKAVLSKLRNEASKLEVHHKKMKKKQQRVEKQVQKAENVENAKSEKEKADASIKLYSFNEYKSSQLPLDREIPDIRIKECKSLEWDIAAMPKTSIIICFVDESWSALLRSVWSVLNRSPHELITEILLIDDGSSASWLGGVGVPKLLDYIANEFPKDVVIKVHSSPKRLGLIRARLFGAGFATGEVLTFLDSHIECNQHWLEPVLDVIGKSRTTVVTPVIDTIDWHNMEHAAFGQRIPAVGTFAWTMDFSWKGGVIRPGDLYTDPVDSPTMAGGLFSIDAKYFQDIGTYDQTMDGRSKIPLSNR